MAWSSGQGDPYRILGVAAEASQQDIVRAYHRSAHHAHPDAHPGDPHAAARFQALTAAYELLSDISRRADFDRRRAGQEQAARRARTRQPAAPGTMAGPRGPSPVQPGPVRIDPPAGQQAQARPPRPWPDDPDEITVLFDWSLDRLRGRLW